MRATEARLRAAGVVFAEREAEWLIECATGIDRAGALREPPVLDVDAAARLDALVARRVAGEPLQYVTGSAAFRHLELAVGPGVFIPRPETELVAERAMERLPRGGTVVDVGTGSGALALAIAQERPDARVIATEVSRDALVWAEKNRATLELDAQLVASDLLTDLPAELAGGIDVVVANPPYVPETDKEFLPADVADHEPSVALFGSADGLAVIRRLACDARAWLRSGGWLVLEIGHDQGARVAHLLEQHGYVDVAISLDLAERERIAEGRR
jgi:release factor glutamine methyltransferase